VTVLIALALVLAIAVGGTVAYLYMSTHSVENTFTAANVSCKVNEDKFDGTTKTGVTVKNTGNVDAYIRAAIVVNWVDDAGHVLGEPVKASDYTITGTSTKWEFKDGYYYYSDVVAADGETEDLIGECTPLTTKDGYYLSVTVLADAIQADGEQARIDAGWIAAPSAGN